MLNEKDFKWDPSDGCHCLVEALKGCNMLTATVLSSFFLSFFLFCGMY